MRYNDDMQKFSALTQWIERLSKQCKRLEESNESYRRTFDIDSFRWIEEDIGAVEDTKEKIRDIFPAFIKRYGIDKENLISYKKWIENQVHLAAQKAKEEKDKIEQRGYYGKYSEARGKLSAYNHLYIIVDDVIKTL